MKSSCQFLHRQSHAAAGSNHCAHLLWAQLTSTLSSPNQRIPHLYYQDASISTSQFPMAPAPTPEQNFRANLSQFRWSRGNNDDSQAQPAQPDSQGSGNNPFSRFYNAIGGGYIPLRSSERSNEDEAYFALSRWER